MSSTSSCADWPFRYLKLEPCETVLVKAWSTPLTYRHAPAAGPSKILSEMRIPGPTPAHPNQEFWEWGPAICVQEALPGTLSQAEVWEWVLENNASYRCPQFSPSDTSLKTPLGDISSGNIGLIQNPLFGASQISVCETLQRRSVCISSQNDLRIAPLFYRASSRTSVPWKSLWETLKYSAAEIERVCDCFFYRIKSIVNNILYLFILVLTQE